MLERLIPSPPAGKEGPDPMEPREVEIHGHRVRYRIAGSGPPLVLIHGITSRSSTWRGVLPGLARRYTVIAPDLVGHGGSAKPRGDYSLGAHASGIRDLLATLGYDRATLIGHSLGGGVALQFAYLFPERIQRLVLVSSGGFGGDVSWALRLAALPGSELALPLLAPRWSARLMKPAAKGLERVGVEASPDSYEIWRSWISLCERETRTAFLHTLRSVIDTWGQKVSALDRLYLASDLPTHIIWGRHDPVIPVAHGFKAHEAIPGSSYSVFEEAGHFPHLQDPDRFCREVHAFISSTRAAYLSPATLRDKLVAGPEGERPRGRGEEKLAEAA